MSLEWKDVVLKDVLSEKGYIRGPFGSALKRAEMKSEGIPVYEQQNAIYNNRIFRYFIDEEKYQSLKRFTTYHDDLIISCSGTVGKVSIIKDNDPKGIISQALLTLRVNKDLILPEFLKYFFSSYEGYNSLVSRSTGSVQVNISKRAVIEDIPLKLPPLDIQQNIVYYLQLIDEKIENCKSINRNLFNIASSIQTEWMINFTPFKSEKFKSSSFGLIPENWNVGKLGDVIELLDSKRIPLSGQQRENMEKIYPYYGAASLMDYVEDYIFDGVYLLMGEDGTVIDDKGFPILQYVWGKFWVNNHAHILKGKNGFNVESLYLLLSKTNIQSIVTGAVQAKVNQSNLKSIEIIIPPVEIMEKFNKLIKPFFDTIRSNNDEIKEIQKLRDTLLPKLMSGEIDVSKINCDMQQISTNNWDNKFTVPLQNNLIKVIS